MSSQLTSSARSTGASQEFSNGTFFFFWMGGDRKCWSLRIETFCEKCIMFLLGRIFQPSFRLCKIWLEKDSSVASSPGDSTLPGDTDLYHVIGERIELAANTAEQGFDVVFPQALQIPQPLGPGLLSAPRNGILRSQNQFNRGNCAEQTDPSQGGVVDHKQEPWSPTPERNTLRTRLWRTVSWTLWTHLFSL